MFSALSETADEFVSVGRYTKIPGILLSSGDFGLKTPNLELMEFFCVGDIPSEKLCSSMLNTPWCEGLILVSSTCAIFAEAQFHSGEVMLMRPQWSKQLSITVVRINCIAL